MGFVYNRYQKEMYIDGHERSDVIGYQKQFLEEISMYQNLMPTFEGQENSVHINDFLTDTIEKLKLNDDQIKEVRDFMHYEARVMINPDKNFDR
ncbi:17346_t:CDS:2 [Funneliformis caledonium]|uniref:17346_t:CDS:1 n=1 Tax=Funneliformis caledonium TaxID=1117310 RepID=A0A9N9D270_9GLOM|nr:17346_t:CDS:2 [Funneliformis caledonium]